MSDWCIGVGSLEVVLQTLLMLKHKKLSSRVLKQRPLFLFMYLQGVVL